MNDHSNTGSHINNEFIEFEQMKKRLREMESRLAEIEQNMNREGIRVASNKVKSARRNLILNYSRFSRIGFIMMILTPIICFRMLDEMTMEESWYALLTAFGFGLYFLTAAIMDLSLKNRLERIRLNEMPVEEVAQKVIRLKRDHQLYMCVLIPFGLGVLALFAYPMLHEKFIIFGMLVGGLTGAAIGTRKYFQMMNEYKNMADS